MSIGILPNVNSIKTNRDVRQGISVCSRIMRLSNNQTKRQKRATIHQKGRESDDKNAVAIVKIVSQMGCVSQDWESLDSQRSRQSRGNPMQKVLGPMRKSTIHSVYAASSKYPGKQRTISWKNTSQTSSPSKSLRCEI